MTEQEITDFIINEVQTHADIMDMDTVVDAETDIFKVTDSLARMEVLFEIEDKLLKGIELDVNPSDYSCLSCAELASAIVLELKDH